MIGQRRMLTDAQRESVLRLPRASLVDELDACLRALHNVVDSCNRNDDAGRAHDAFVLDLCAAGSALTLAECYVALGLERDGRPSVRDLRDMWNESLHRLLGGE